jgi:hypothetical protein
VGTARLRPHRHRTTPDEPLSYRAVWWNELRAGVNGQDARFSASWRRDSLWKAACYEAALVECLELLASALDHNAHVATISALLRDVEHAKQRAHEAFLEDHRHGAATRRGSGGSRTDRSAGVDDRGSGCC